MTSSTANQSTKKLFIKTRNKTETDNEKIIEFEEPLLNVKEIKLNSIQLHNSYSNINKKNDSITITTQDKFSKTTDHKLTFREEAFYTIDHFCNIINLFLNQSIWPENIKGNVEVKIQHDLANNKVVITKEEKNELELNDFRITSEFLHRLGFKNTKLIPIPAESDYGVKLSPYTNFQVHCDLVTNTTYNGKESDILCLLPVDQKKRWWDSVTYRNIGCTLKPNKKEINSIKLWITDEDGNHIDFNGYPILYELKVIFDTAQDKQLTQAIQLTHDIGQSIKRIFPDENNEDKNNEEY